MDLFFTSRTKRRQCLSFQKLEKRGDALKKVNKSLEFDYPRPKWRGITPNSWLPPPRFLLIHFLSHSSPQQSCGVFWHLFINKFQCISRFSYPWIILPLLIYLFKSVPLPNKKLPCMLVMNIHAAVRPFASRSRKQVLSTKHRVP